MKNFIAILISVLFLLNCLSPCAGRESDNFTPVYAKVSANNVNIRAGQGTNFEVIGQLKRGAQVAVIGEKYGWYKIDLPKAAACYVHKNYITEGRVTAKRLRLRAGKGTNFNVLGTLRRGEAVKVLAEEGNWLKIVPPAGSAGWVKKDYLTLSKKKFVRKIIESPILPQTEIKARGVINDLGRIVNRRGTHKLTDGKKVLYYLKSKNIDLNLYVYEQVELKGKLLKFKDSAYPLIDVQWIQVKQ